MQLQEYLAFYVAFLRVLYNTHQNYHWLTKGENFYGNHLLFERIYKSAQENADLAAEKFIGVFGPEALDISLQNKLMNKITSLIENEDLIVSSLNLEEKFQKYSKTLYQTLNKADKLSLGVDDMLMSIASQREEAIYLLKQAST